MTELRLGDQLYRFDRGATIAAYSALSEGWADRCTCSGCRNFVRQRGSIYPAEFSALLETLGIDPHKEGEAVHYGPTRELHFYGGWFYFVGEVLQMGESIVTISLGPTPIDSNYRASPVPDKFQYFIRPGFPQPPAAFGETVVAVEFSTLLPWVLEDPYE